jgi:putative tricarboxylic transport membrane protein
MSGSSESLRYQTLIGAAAIGVAAVLAIGAMPISSAVGYSGVGPNFLPWVVSAVMLICGIWLVWEARTGGFRQMDVASGAPKGDWYSFAWVSAGILANAALMTRIGFVFSCALCFVLAVRGLRNSEGRAPGDLRQTLVDAVTGLAISAPAYWIFAKFLAINLPGLTGTGWL